MASPSQKAAQRPISFMLTDDRTGTSKTVTFAIRPEDLSRSEPSLLTATQTFDGAWIDDFGPGLATIQISGNTGWNVGGGWEQNFQDLRTAVFADWHRLRNEAVKAGADPDKVKLVFADALDSIVSVVAPGNFTLKRNKARPLLMMYQITLTVIGDQLTDSTPDPLNLSGTGNALSDLSTGLDSLQNSLSKIASAAGSARSFLNAAVASPMQAFMGLTTTALGKVLGSAGAGLGNAATRQLIGVASDMALVGRNAFYTYNASVPDEPTQFAIAGVAAAYENAYCVLRNAFAPPRQFPDYSSLYGASVCSSTVGGSPLSVFANSNPFETLIDSTQVLPSVTADAQANINLMKATDPVLAPIGLSDLGSRLASIASGVVFQ